MSTETSAPGSTDAPSAGTTGRSGVPPPNGAGAPSPGDPALDLRLKASQAAQERTRLAFFAVTIIALAMVTASWNGYVSFYRDVSYEFADLAEDKSGKGGPNQLGTQTLQKEVLAAWVRSRVINVSLLGISVGVDDAATVGAVALLVALLWYYFVIRRENHTIGRLLFDYHNAPVAVRWLIFHGINSYTVFSNIGQSDDPIISITEPPVEKKVWLLRFLSHNLHYLPFAGFALLIGLELLSLVRASPFRPPFNKCVISILWEEGRAGEIFWLVVWRLVGIALAYPVFCLCWRINWFAHATEDNIRGFHDELTGEQRPVTG